MSTFEVAFDRQNRVATILQPGAELPEGSEKIGELNTSAISPNPTDLSTQHVHNLLMIAGETDVHSVTVKRQSIAKVIEQSDQVPAAEMQAELTDGLPTTAEMAVGDVIDLVEGSTKGYDFEIRESEDDIVKLDKRNGKLTALKAGTAEVTVINGENRRTVTLTVSEPVVLEADAASADKETADS